MNGSPADKSELKLKYAWDWFSYHAAQRLTGFRFFLVSAGILLAAIANFSNQPWVVVCVCALGGALAILFVLLDFRNAHLLSRGEIILAKFEDELFEEEIANDADFRGLLRKESSQSWYQSFFGSRFAKHAWIIPFAELASFALFVMLIFVVNGANPENWSKREDTITPVRVDLELAPFVDLTNSIDEIRQDIRQLRLEVSFPDDDTDVNVGDR